MANVAPPQFICQPLPWFLLPFLELEKEEGNQADKDVWKDMCLFSTHPLMLYSLLTPGSGRRLGRGGGWMPAGGNCPSVSQSQIFREDGTLHETK